MPGTLCTSDVFSPVLDRLAIPVECRVPVSTDCASIDDLWKLLPGDLGSDDLICGFSLGAIAALHLLPKLPRLAGAIVIGATARPDIPQNLASRRTLEARIQAGDVAGAIESLWPNLVADQNIGTTVLKQEIVAMALETAGSVTAQTTLALSRPGVFDTLGSVETPVLAITGEQDRATPPDRAWEISRIARHGECAIIADAGHFALLEQPSSVAMTIQIWLSLIDGRENGSSSKPISK
ncbi:MAG: alpha/beta hydrolase [Proteobacteria bacterium]|nr:alpha/beta hydrolase [Pseudomonadota bacterium]